MASEIWKIFLILLMSVLAGGSFILKEYRVNSEISHLVYHNLKNAFYVGAVNRVIKLDANLELQQNVITGPELDNYLCGSSCIREKVLTDNYNKILLIDKNVNGNDRLIVCGSLFQGYCEFRDLENIGSKISTSNYTMLVANEGNASTVGLVVQRGLSENIMYIGASYPTCVDDLSSNVLYLLRKEIPSLSMRQLTSMNFSLVQESGSFSSDSASALKLKPDEVRRYVINYVSAFSVGIYSYFLTVQPVYYSTPNCFVDEQTKYSVPSESKISLTCHSDIRLYSYIDIPLRCNTSTTDFPFVRAGKTIIPGSNLQTTMKISNEILLALFQKRNENGLFDSAVCVYSIADIQQTMTNNLQRCYAGDTSYQGKRFVDGAPCPQAQGMSSINLCNTIQKPYGRVSGIIPAISQPAIIFQNTNLTSVTLTVTSNFTVAFLGTSSGRLKKIVIENKTSAREYDSDVVIDDGSPIMQDTVYDPINRNLFVTSKRLVAKVAVENCRQYTSCTECLAKRDPFCGWCTLENSCKLRSECNMSQQYPDRWKIGKDGKECTAIDSISPPQASSTENITLYLSIIDIPRDTGYSCVFDFGDKQQLTSVIPWNFGVSCRTPHIASLGINFGPTGSINATLSIRSEETQQLFVSQKFTFYNCGSFSSCSSCTNNLYACDWCVYENKCTFRTEPCNGDTIYSRNVDNYNPDNFTINNNYGDGIRRGPMFCPKIDTDHTGKLYIHNGTSKEIVIRGSYFPEVRDGSRYRCIITVGFGNGDIETFGTRETEYLLKCVFPVKHYRLPRNGTLESDLRVTWGEGGVLESNGAKVNIYSCAMMAQGDCSLCKNFEEFNASLNCRWCDNPHSCQYRDHCAASSSVTTCPAPEVEMVKPMKGHILGGTFVTIQGKNLGAKLSDIQHNVTIAGVACEPNSGLYKPAREIVCKLGPSNAGVKTGPVVVLNKVFSAFQFKYLEPVFEIVNPSTRATSGGALIRLYGNPIYIGTTLSVTVSDKVCSIKSKMETEITCTLPPSQTEGYAPIRVLIDSNIIRVKDVISSITLENGQQIRGNTSFYYVADPTITSITPLESFRSGGRRLTIIGTNIDIIDQPKMFISKNSLRSDLTVCKVKNSTCMICPTPVLPNSTLATYKFIRRSTDPATFQIGFVMDDVPKVQNMSNFPNVIADLHYFTDPVVQMFEPSKSENENVKVFKSEILIISGKGLLAAAKREDVQVFIGNTECNVTNLSEDQIVCNPPVTQPSPVAEKDRRSDIPAVIVQIGNRRYFVGYLEYESPSVLGIPLDYIIAGVSGVGFFIILTIIVCCCIYKRQKNKSKRDFEKMRYQLDSLESNVRNECKQAFAELQTDMTDLTAEIGDGKKPLYRYDDYTFKILFPQMLDHVVLHPPIPKHGNNERHPDVAICHFSQLLQHKQFLLKFIRTLEKQKSFSIRDKSNVASLLIILYQNNMEYITEIIKALLKDLVEKSVEGKHPKLMLRRTESVVEKLLANWLALCMYKNLEESTGSSLYLLYQAIKFQVMKGPVDAVTGDARYSLSEDRLLRTENRLEPVSLTLNVEYEGKRYKCRCLDCDTISQAKEKMLDSIYRNIPYTTRPAAEDLDLDWVNENKTLQDEDNLKMKENGWKQLNMLKDYKIPNGADVVLTQYQKCRTLPRSPNGSVHSSGFSYKEAVPITRTDSEVSTKYWHLVKQPDDAQAKGLSSEIYLTRLLATKGTLKQYVDDFMKTVLTANPNMLPVIKYLFDFLDEAARQYNITDPEVAYTWKCNSLLLRFWVNIIKNPDFVFDIHKTNIVDSCLSVVAQCFMDSCSTSDQNLSKDSPSNKLLFAKDIPVFKGWVCKYFDDIQRMPAVSDQDLNAYLAEVSRMSTNYFTKDNALFELYNYVQKYSNEINESLEADSFTKAQQLPDRLGNVITNMEGPSNVALAYV